MSLLKYDLFFGVSHAHSPDGGGIAGVVIEIIVINIVEIIGHEAMVYARLFSRTEMKLRREIWRPHWRRSGPFRSPLIAFR